MRQFLFVAALAGACAPAVAQDILPYAYHIDDFDNGLRLITIPTDFPDVVSLHIVVSTGSRNEVEEGKSGFAHFFEHMMFRGSKNYTSAQQAAMFKEAGADRNAYTTDDYTNYHTTITKDDLEQVMMLEADRFQYLQYSPKQFRTEAMAVFGEYNKNSANPVRKAMEVIRDRAFDAHTYKHTTMGFLRDIRAMPRQFDYSKEFFSRWYKPEYTTILVVGDVTRKGTKDLVQKYWGAWKRGSYTVDIPVEPKQTGPRNTHIQWPAETQPWVWLAFKGPAFDADSTEMPAIDLMGQLAFSPSSEIYRKLYVRERKVDQMFSYFPDATDPGLLMIAARVRDPKDWGYVRDQLLATCESIKTAEIDEKRLAAVKSNMRYSFANRLDSSEAIASALAGYIARTRTPETVNKVYRAYDRVTADDVRRVAAKFFVTNGRTIATVSHKPLPEAAPPADEVAKPATNLANTVLAPSGSPLVSFRLRLDVGAAHDPAGKEGLAYLTAQMISDGGTKHRSYEELTDALYPMAGGAGSRVDKETTVFSGTAHSDNLEAYYALFKEMLQEPGFREDDFERIRSDALTRIETSLRRVDDEELGKEVLYTEIYAGHPYGHTNYGTVQGLKAITLDDVKAFYAKHYTGEKLTLGMAGGYPDGAAEHVHRDFFGEGAQAEPASVSRSSEIGAPKAIPHNRMTIVKKQARATGIHVGFPIEVTRGHPDWPALWLVRSYFGEHRSENSYLYQRLREIRGLNYGDYAYIEYFPNGGGQFQPPPNVARSQQIFQIWIRPVPPQNGPFAFKATYYELQKLVRDGISKESFEATRNFLMKSVSLLVKTDGRQLGYALDSEFYGIGSFADHVRAGLSKLTHADVNRVIREHLRADRLQFVVITEDAEGFRDSVLGDAPVTIEYQAKPGAEILAEDEVIGRLKVDMARDAVRIVPVEEIFEKK